MKPKGVYSHFALNGSTLSESQKKLYEMMKKKEEDKGKLDDMATKDSVKKDDEKKEEKPDTRAMYAKIAMVKNKLRSMGQKDPMVMAVDACEERTPAVPGEMGKEYMENTKKSIKASKKKDKKPHNPYPDAPKGSKQATPENMAPGKP